MHRNHHLDQTVWREDFHGQMQQLWKGLQRVRSQVIWKLWTFHAVMLGAFSAVIDAHFPLLFFVSGGAAGAFSYLWLLFGGYALESREK